MNAKRMPMMDAAFLQMETHETPMHVAALQIFKLSDGASSDFCKKVVMKMRETPIETRPWNLKLAQAPFSRLAPAFTVAAEIDVEYHVRHTCLPAPGGERELGELISHLHSTTLDRSRPLWTCHVIEGLDGNRFAIYAKIHHALADGVRGMQLLARGLGRRAEPGNWAAPWSPTVTKPHREKPRSHEKLTPFELPAAVSNVLAPFLRWSKSAEPVRLPFEAPLSMLNRPVTGARRVATQSLDLAQIKTIARQTNASVNDLFLAICGSALRRHLQDFGELPDKSLIAGVPVSLRANSNNPDAGNAVGFLWSLLGTDLHDPLERLSAINRSMRASKEHLQSLPPQARAAFTMTTMMPAIVALMSGQAPRFRPPMNVIISSVPGPRKSRYLDEARLDAIYPLSIPFQGLALNITCVSYDGRLTIGFTGSRDCLPSLKRLAVYAGDAVQELSDAMTEKASCQLRQ